eukprot:CAMPEP_0119331566 /NCGR_PEP_ID=MMETSP1333-20130426/80828_1 /TAXON_ID=418940 /ORGANISM="Scyphosphaera apsteinii, Strain RCC1455" /LENGTH=1014 /DNA_ID=CAMNT_0007341197 /DNA_START=36 /DNA_END=3080 /DNA_ORIENTATION=+
MALRLTLFVCGRWLDRLILATTFSAVNCGFLWHQHHPDLREGHSDKDCASEAVQQQHTLISAAETVVLGDVGEFPVDEHSRLTNHWLLLREGCTEAHASVMQQDRDQLKVGIAAGTLAEKLGMAKGCPSMACLERGLHPDLLSAGVQLPSPNDLQEDVNGWIRTKCEMSDVGLVNLLEEELSLRWLDADRKSDSLPEGGTNNGITMYRFQYWYRAAIGERFEVLSSTGMLLLHGVVEFSGAHVVGASEPFSAALDPHRDWEPVVNATMKNERLRAAKVYTAYTSTGAKVLTVPSRTWASISAYYHNNRNTQIREEWQPDANFSFVNFWQVPVFCIPLPPRLKRVWHRQLMPSISDWVGGVELEPTDMYGFRVYSEGALLFPHVDREETHAVSAVINVAQGEMREPWPLEVDSMNGTITSAVLEPGEMVGYESARCLHGRSTHLQGSFFVNLFVHYRPKNDPHWFRRPSDKAEKLNIEASQGNLRQLSFILANGAAQPVQVLWESPLAGLQPVEEIETGGDRRINSRFGHRFVVRGACERDINVTAEFTHETVITVCLPPGMDPPKRPKRQSAALTMVNEGLLEVDVFWQSSEVPGGSQHVGTIMPSSGKTFYSFVGHVFRFAGGDCAGNVTVHEDNQEKRFCGGKDLRQTRATAVQDAIATASKLVFAKFRNLAGRSVSLWHCTSGTLMSEVPPNGPVAITSYITHVFAVSEVDEREGCSRSIKSFTIEKDIVLYAFDDGTGSESDRAQWATEQAAAVEYHHRTGRHWIGFYPRQPPDLYMQPAESIGNELKVHTYSPPRPQNCTAAGLCIGCGSTNLTLRVISTSPRVFMVKEFLSEDEVRHLIELGKPSIERSTTMSKVSSTRTSRNTWIARNTSPVTERIYRRIADLMGVDEQVLWDKKPGKAEPIQLVHYASGQRYDAHYDWGVGSASTRFATVLIYLNIPQEGGLTAFPKATTSEPLAVHPGLGGAILFYNILQDGNPDRDSLHAALPVIEGEKWLANVWVWDPERGDL